MSVRNPRLLFIICLLALSISSASALMVEDFESGDIGAWLIEPPYYTNVSLVSPGAGGSSRALAIQEITGSQGGHSINALAHWVFTTPQDWSSYVTLQLDVNISAGLWNGYSIRIYNGVSPQQSVLLRGLHPTTPAGTWTTVSFDISAIPRDQISEIVIYVNRTSRDAGQILTIDNVQVTTTPVPPPPATLMLQDGDSGGDLNYDLSRWQDPYSHVYQTIPSVIADPPNGNVMKIARSGPSTSAYGRWTPVRTMDWYDYVTLEFDAKVDSGYLDDGFAVFIYNQGDPQSQWGTPDQWVGYGVKLRKFSPGIGSYVTCQLDLTGVERDQISCILFYINRVGGNPIGLRIDNIRLSQTPAAPSPDVFWLEDFDVYGTNDPPQWDYVYNTTRALNPTDYRSAPNSLDIVNTEAARTSTSLYARRSWAISGPPDQVLEPPNYIVPDMQEYNSLIFDAKVIPGTSPKLSKPIGFSANINGITGDVNRPFYPSAYNTWETFTVDISGNPIDNIRYLRFYTDRCDVDDVGQILRIDNIRVSKEPAPPPPTIDPNVENFEDGEIADWWYDYQYFDQMSGITYQTAAHELTIDASGGQYAIKIRNNTQPPDFPGHWFAHTRKTIHQDWTGYKTLLFDAKMANSSTSSGFGVGLRTVGGSLYSGYNTIHPFAPTTEWQTFAIDITSDNLTEVTGIGFFVNLPDPYGRRQDGAQELYIDNIRLTTDGWPAVSTIASAKARQDGTILTLSGKVSTGQILGFGPDPFDFGASPTPRNMFFLEEPDRSAAIAVLAVDSTASDNDVPSGTKVNVTGTLLNYRGTRIIRAIDVVKQTSGNAIPEPLAIPHRACGSGPYSLDAGVPNFYGGLDTTGMLVTVVGKVLAVYNDGVNYWAYIDDGSQVTADNGEFGLKVYDSSDFLLASTPDPVGRTLQATGFVLNDPEKEPPIYGSYTGKTVRSLRPKPDLAGALRWLN